MEIAAVVLSVGLLVFLAHLFAALFETTRVPDVLPLVVLGVVVGPVLGLITPHAFGKVGGIFSTISLVVILFEGGLGIKLSTLTGSLAPGLRLTLWNFGSTVAATTAVGWLVFGMPPSSSAMLGAILGGTSSAVVIPMIGKLPLSERARTALFLESSLSDVLCIVGTLTLMQALKFDQLQPSLMVGQIMSTLLLAALIGVGGAIFWSAILDRVRQLENGVFTTPAFAFVLYGIAELLGYSGAISALAFGIGLGNIQSFENRALKSLASFRPITINEAERAFYRELVFLLKTFFFVYIGLSIRLSDVALVATGLGISSMLFALRVPVVRASLGRATPRFDARVAAALVPKGLAAAVLASLPLQAGLPYGAIIQDVVYAVVLFSIVTAAVLVFLLEKRVVEWPYPRAFADYGSVEAKDLEDEVRESEKTAA